MMDRNDKNIYRRKPSVIRKNEMFDLFIVQEISCNCRDDCDAKNIRQARALTPYAWL